MMRRGLTMVEMLIALGLLSVLAAALLSWMQTTLRGGAETLQEARWRSAADAVLELIHDDLASGDFAAASKRTTDEKVTVEENILTIRCRDAWGAGAGGPIAQHRYELDRIRGSLILTTIDERSQARRTRTLLTLVEDFALTLDDEERILRVAIGGSSGATPNRSFLIP